MVIVSAGTGTVTATAKATVTVKVPKLILLRVGSEGAVVDNLEFVAAPNVASAPGTSLVDGNNQAATWNGAAPTFADPASQALTAYSWTNSPGGATLTCATVADTLFTAGDGLEASDITVTSSGSLAHPGANTACGGSTPIAKNTLAQATWTYAVSGAALADASAGEHKQTTTYTATSL